jgi:hypothetical protein
MAPNSVRSLDVAGKTTEVTAATKNAGTITELISTIPQTWRPALADYLNKVYRVAQKLCNVQNTIATYDRHIAESSFPASIRNSVKDLKIQFSKEYLGTEQGSLYEGLAKSEVHNARKALLAFSLRSKKEELAILQKQITYDGDAWRKILFEVATRVATTFNGTVEVKGNGSGDLDWSASVPATLREDCKILWGSGQIYHYRAVSLARSLADRSLVEKTRKLSIKASTDAEMKDVDSERTTRDLIKEEMQSNNRLLKQELAKMLGQSNHGKRLDRSLTLNRQSEETRPAKRRKERRAEQKPDRRQEGTSQEREEGKEMKINTSAFLEECSKDFRPWLPETYPNVYTRLSLDTRIKIGFAFSKPWEIDTLRAASPGIFKHPDVSIPEDLEYMLAVNHKFILYQAPQNHDVESAKESFTRTVRNRWFFREKEDKEFIPKFHVKSSYWQPPKAAPHIEQGIKSAMEVIDSQVSRALVSIAERSARPALTKWAQVQDFLQENKLLVKLTDKNLGLAIFPVSWYDVKVLELLSDTNTYKPVFDVPTQVLRQKLNDRLSVWRLPSNMDKYISRKTEIDIPEFHGIPKVHKKPWTLRPIVPSHSWVTSCVSTVLDHLCQPLLKHMPWIVESTKTVINQLENVRDTKHTPIWIMTGDVVSCYSNIPPKLCAKTIANLWRRHCSGSTIKMAAIRDMATFIMDNNYLSYRGQAFHQINGLAMGTACAPVLANLYMGYHEEQQNTVNQPGVLLYVRYIDDILCLFQGTKEEAISFSESVKLGPLKITWSIDPLRNEFLDIELLKTPDAGLRAVHTRLYRKELNRHLYIPWSSAHPLHVKKGFVKAELTRFAMICSKPEYFADARTEFYGNLRRRGYPAKTLIEWFRQVSYGDRPVMLLPKIKEQDFAPLMLPGHYNPVWDYVDVKEIITSARRFWTQEELPVSLEEPLIRSLGKTTSLFDLLSTWNKTTLLSSSTCGPASPPDLSLPLRRGARR